MTVTHSAAPLRYQRLIISCFALLIPRTIFQRNASSCHNIQACISVRTIERMEEGILPEASSSSELEEACTLEVEASSLAEVVPGNRQEHRTAGIAALEASLEVA